MSTTMAASVLIRVLERFDSDGEVKMNKISAGSYSVPGSGYGAYNWTFHGPIDGEDTRLKLVRTAEKEYTLYRTITNEVQEVIKT